MESVALIMQAHNDLEKEIEGILTKSHLLSEKDVNMAEQLAMNKIDPEEVYRRSLYFPLIMVQVKKQRMELQKMRSLLFHQEQKERRKSKIKSKKYHRILKKEKEKQKAALESLQELDHDAASVEKLDMERRRAEERMSLRHGKASKWASRSLFSTVESDEVRAAKS